MAALGIAWQGHCAAKQGKGRAHLCADTQGLGLVRHREATQGRGVEA